MDKGEIKEKRRAQQQLSSSSDSEDTSNNSNGRNQTDTTTSTTGPATTDTSGDSTSSSPSNNASPRLGHHDSSSEGNSRATTNSNPTSNPTTNPTGSSQTGDAAQGDNQPHSGSSKQVFDSGLGSSTNGSKKSNDRNAIEVLRPSILRKSEEMPSTSSPSFHVTAQFSVLRTRQAFKAWEEGNYMSALEGFHSAFTEFPVNPIAAIGLQRLFLEQPLEVPEFVKRVQANPSGTIDAYVPDYLTFHVKKNRNDMQAFAATYFSCLDDAGSGSIAELLQLGIEHFFELQTSSAQQASAALAKLELIAPRHYVLGSMYASCLFHGLGSKLEKSQAVKHFEKAYHAGSTHALFNWYDSFLLCLSLAAGLFACIMDKEFLRTQKKLESTFKRPPH